MPFINRFNTVTCGAMTFTGNTLGLSKETNTNNAGTNGAIGAFTTLNAALPPVDAFPIDPGPLTPGATTTLNFNQNSSAALLNIPAGSTVLYAELIWGGNYESRDQNIIGSINNSVTFTGPSGAPRIVAPDPVTANTGTIVVSGNDISFYMRSADVTNIVIGEGAGQYSTGGVPGLVDPLNASMFATNHAGWTLAVVYRNIALPLRNMTLFVGANGIVSTGNSIVDVPVSGFSTPAAGPVNGRVLLSAGEGDAAITGDQARFAPTAADVANPAFNLSGPNNFSTNFFASQINDDTGNLDTSGTYGSRNQINGAPGTNIVAGRQGWDITNVDASANLVNNQMSAVFRFTSIGDAYMPNALGIQIDEGDPVFEVLKSVNPLLACPGDVLTYTITVTNTGLSDADNVIFTDVIPSGVDFIDNSVIVDGIQLPGSNPAAGINIGTLAIGQTRTISFSVLVRAKQPPCFVTDEAEIEYEGCPGKVTTSNKVITNICKNCNDCRPKDC
ncbi:DUF11 domain-containing protein [Pontibacillus litoralis]|uniref:DUF11 domain-containing protein n=1 Tax=Pontibacillus litoralis JSM 072002 TaxID=1385512 RepID=A0A0A5G242_9BACI|nr:DUF11 domain-containing protein [Pontibacillus litoralis]KGX85145.1 hypothetical protein N784_10180 [Pontibacillus litoralis JSM 072002]